MERKKCSLYLTPGQAEAIRYVMQNRRLNQKQTAMITGCAESSLSSYLSGLPIPTSRARKLYNALGQDPRIQFLTRSFETESDWDRLLNDGFEEFRGVYDLVDDETRRRMINDMREIQESYKPPYSMR